MDWQALAIESFCLGRGIIVTDAVLMNNRIQTNNFLASKQE